MLYVFKLSEEFDPHNSNLLFDEALRQLACCRPDYIVDVLDSTNDSYVNCIGEVKPNDDNELEIAIDKFRLGLLSRLELVKRKVKTIIDFQAIGNKVTFLIFYKYSKFLYIQYESDEIEFPMIYSKFSNITACLNSLYNIASIYESYCLEDNSIEQYEPTPTLSYEAFKKIYGLDSNKSSRSSSSLTSPQQAASCSTPSTCTGLNNST